MGAKGLKPDAGASKRHTRLEETVCLPGAPQQETSHDCGFFILEMILRALQLTPDALRELATASSVEIAMLPWPSQKQVFRRKAKLREALEVLMTQGQKLGTGDVEAILKANPDLRKDIRKALIDGGSSFSDGFERWAAGDWDLSPSPSRSVDRGDDEGSEEEDRKKKKKKKKKRKRETSSSEEDDDSRRKRSRTDSDKEGPAANKNGNAAKAKPEEPKKMPTPTFTMAELESLSAGKLKALCVEHKVLPVAALEKNDFLQALRPLAREPPKPKAPPPPPQHTPGPAPLKRFSRQDLDKMSVKELKVLCIQRKVLPAAAAEKADFVQALAPLAT